MKYAGIRLVMLGILGLGVTGGVVAGAVIANDKLQTNNEPKPVVPPPPPPPSTEQPGESPEVNNPILSSVTINPLSTTSFSVGDSVTLNCNVVSSNIKEGDIKFQWYKNDQPISGANQKSYTFTCALSDNNASFKVKVSYDSLPAKESSSITITVKDNTPPSPPPSADYPGTLSSLTIDDDGANHQFIEHSEIILDAMPSYTDDLDIDLIQYQWYKQDSAGNKTKLPDQTTQSLEITDATMEYNNVSFYCVATYGTQVKETEKYLVNIVADTGGSTPSPSPQPEPQPNPQPSPSVDLDTAPSVNLTTPAGYTSWKGKLKKVDLVTPIGENAINDVFKKITFEDMEKEFVYHARFMMYQTFGDNFSEINYYSKATSTGYECVCEGIVKETVTNARFFVQDVGTSLKGTYSFQKGQKVKTILSPIRSSFPSSPLSASTMQWSFAKDVDNIDKTSRTQFNTQLSGYSAQVTIDGANYKNWNYDVLRSFYFTLGRLKTLLN